MGGKGGKAGTFLFGLRGKVGNLDFWAGGAILQLWIWT